MTGARERGGQTEEFPAAGRAVPGPAGASFFGDMIKPDRAAWPEPVGKRAPAAPVGAKAGAVGEAAVRRNRPLVIMTDPERTLGSPPAAVTVEALAWRRARNAESQIFVPVCCSVPVAVRRADEPWKVAPGAAASRNSAKSSTWRR